MDKFISYMVLEAVMLGLGRLPDEAQQLPHLPRPDEGQDHLHPLGHGPDVRRRERPGHSRASAAWSRRAAWRRPRAASGTSRGPRRSWRRSTRPTSWSSGSTNWRSAIQPELAKVDAGAGRDYKNQVNRLRDAIKQREKIVERTTRRTDEVKSGRDDRSLAASRLRSRPTSAYRLTVPP